MKLRYLITGGTGSWGQELTRQLLERDPLSITIYSRGEFAQVTMQRKFNDKRLKFIVGDVRDFDQLNVACREIDVIYHLAALKHIPICEDFPYEAMKTNITGTENVIQAALINSVDRVVDVSTDKAANPLNIYGMTKAIGEKLILHANRQNSTRFVCIRGGNVLGSNGSVVPLFIDQIKRYNRVTITSDKMTRYFLTLQEAVKLVLTAGDFDMPGGLFVMRMPSCKIIDLAKVLVDHYGNSITAIEQVGVRLGEKLHETLITEYEAPDCYQFGDNYFVVYHENIGLPRVGFTSYTSDSQALMSQEMIARMLTEGGFLQ